VNGNVPAGFAFNVAESPTQIVVLAIAASTGLSLTVTDTIAEPVQPAASVTYTVYVCKEVGLTVIEGLVCPPGAHRKRPAGTEVAFNVAERPWQIVSPFAVTVGLG
jgi:hypothetical protein